MILSAMFGACTLIMAISPAADLLPALSIMSAAFRHRRREHSMSILAVAILCSQTLCAESGLPKATRDCSLFTIAANASSATPIVRMQ